MNQSNDMGDRVIIALRRVIRAVDLHSRTLAASHGLTGPQALILKALQKGSLSAGELASRVSLSQGTVTDILNRLEQRGFIRRLRDTRDRRRVLVEVTLAGLALLQQSPPLLQDRFIQRFHDLHEWEQTQLLSSLQRIAAMISTPVRRSSHPSRPPSHEACQPAWQSPRDRRISGCDRARPVAPSRWV